MIVANEQGFSERNVDTAIAGEGFHLIIAAPSEIGQLSTGRWSDILSHLKTRLYRGGRLIIAAGIEEFGTAPKGSRQHSWSSPND